MQVFGDNAEVVNDGKVDGIEARLPRPLLFCSLRAFNHVASQVFAEADGTKITYYGTRVGDNPVIINVRIPRPTASGGLDASLTRRCSIREPTSR